MCDSCMRLLALRLLPLRLLFKSKVLASLTKS
jgi:hypothetical protein